MHAEEALNGLIGKYPAKAHALRVAQYIHAKMPHTNGFLFLTGAREEFYDDSDLAIPYRQQRPFMYLTGVTTPNCHLIYDIRKAHLTLFVPPINPEEIIWSGLPPSNEEILGKYDVDSVLSNTELQSSLDFIGSQACQRETAIFTSGDHQRSGYKFPTETVVDSTLLKEATDECRVIKDDYEIALMYKANIISSVAHRAVIKSLKECRTESEIDGVFLGECTKQGAKMQAYPSIVASGRTAATMHYESNNQNLYQSGKPKDVVVVDAGAEWNCYGADITRTLPISGRFTRESRAIYDIVLNMQEQCIAELKEGVLWDDLHILAHKVAIDGLLALGILEGDKDEILRERVSTAFMPHGLGHFLGMDTHDTGGQCDKTDDNLDPMFKYLRVRRHLPAGCIVTVEPGIHFNEHVIRPLLRDERLSKFIDEQVLNRYWDVGGVCIEDDLLVTESGSINLTNVPKDPDELEKILSGVAANS
ncbi:xaa-Pro dipeptidase [Colletotrichum scovillei]|uniref:Xaa-Pro aminopeptidase n=1 Tax=Colletotrichum scovillei TaxID=1209932 RepID=A0A9P7R8V4_9PEZI|nr:xaa-Pro dipeptidase [Colletotrichum scovillei]KAG7071346.1 xaa-Pro dipeptidase [Colletotrichum scovillei]KAG7079622.1 xaa-Pro dipeptidase [Colletotrichum scovillei]